MSRQSNQSDFVVCIKSCLCYLILIESSTSCPNRWKWKMPNHRWASVVLLNHMMVQEDNKLSPQTSVSSPPGSIDGCSLMALTQSFHTDQSRPFKAVSDQANTTVEDAGCHCLSFCNNWVFLSQKLNVCLGVEDC